MVAQVVAHGQDRGEAIARLREALEQFEIEGIKTNLIFLQAALRWPAFLAGDLDTGLADAILADPAYKARWKK
jgi:acetyl-CoA carboxylase biotin carboxylase subunit